ncbi:MAG: hypothetical protein JWQ40_2018 [Segetibacter sp.]|nr:hypothetical protein [Segetibacter sp.]
MNVLPNCIIIDGIFRRVISLFKCRLQLEAFSGKTAIAVKHDFFEKIFTMTTAAVLAFPVDEKNKKEFQTNTRKHPNKVNRTNAFING